MSQLLMTSVDQKIDTLFVSMPFGPLTTPSIALGLLKSILCQQGIDSKVLYFTLEFATRIAPEAYQAIAFSPTNNLVGEWLFSQPLFEGTTHPQRNVERFLARSFGSDRYNPELIEDVRKIQGEVEQFLEDCLQEVLAYSPKIVGFTSNFQQQVASLSLAKRIKAANPAIKIVFGGANVEGNMGLETVRQFPFVDAVVSGEADLIVVDLFQRLLADRPYSDMAGVFTQQNAELHLSALGSEASNAPQVRDMNALPYPDYEDFFAEWRQLDWKIAEEELDEYQPSVLIQTARGCWWGERQHCTFCGLNGSGMNFRSMSAQQALEQITFFASKYPGAEISCVDNILDMRYFKDLLPALAQLDLKLDLFYEVKANLRKEQVRLLREAGVSEIQPGIESFSDHVLDLMGKGVSSFQNIQLLKWCKEFGVTPFWSILWGFPAETSDDYRQMTSLLPSLFHLTPPITSTNIRLDRFSPNFVNAEAFGFKDVRPYPAYSEVYPAFSDASRFNLAYYFTYDYQAKEDISTQTEQLAQLVAQWKSEHRHSTLFYMDKGDFLLICDTRSCAERVFHRIPEPARTLYLHCDGMRSMRQLQKHLAEVEIDLTEQEVRTILRPVINANFMVYNADKDLFLSLALSDETYSPPKEALEEMYRRALETGEMAADGQLHVAV